MTNVPVWIDGAPIRKFPKLERNLDVDVAVVGAGITGIITAYCPKRVGLTVVLERERVASIDSGHTTAHLTCVTDVRLRQLAKTFGADHAKPPGMRAQTLSVRLRESLRRNRWLYHMKELDSYLNDHLAGSVSALELIGHWKDVQKGDPLGGFFAEAEREIKTDQDILRDVMHCLGIKESSVRKAAAWVGAEIGRARLMIAGDEPASLELVLSLEALVIGIHGKKLMWRSLAAAKLPKLSKWDFEELQRRSEEQIERTEAQRIWAARRAFAGRED